MFWSRRISLSTKVLRSRVFVQAGSHPVLTADLEPLSHPGGQGHSYPVSLRATNDPKISIVYHVIKVGHPLWVVFWILGFSDLEISVDT